MYRRAYRWLDNIPLADPNERRMAALVQMMLIGMAGLILITIVIWAAISRNIGDSVRPTLIGLTIVLFIGAALRILRRGQVNQAVLLATAGLLLALAFNFNGLGVRDGSGVMIAFILPILLAGFMSGRRGLALTSVATVALVALTAAMESHAPGLAGYAAPEGLPNSIVIALFALIVALIGFFIDQFVSALRSALAESLAREQDLQGIRLSLEARTAELSLAKEALEGELAVRRQAEAALTYERDLLHALMDNLPDTISFKDAESRFTRVNRAQARLLGIADPSEAIGRTDFDFQSHELARRFYDEEQRIVAGGEPLIDRIEFNPTPDGRPRYFSATKVPIRNQAGQVIGIVAVSRDITARHEVERLKDEFIGTVSHELRTPLMSIRGSLGLLSRGAAGEIATSAQEMVEIAYRNSERLTRLVDDLLDIEKIESGKMLFRMAPIELAPLVEQALDANRAYAEQYGVTFALARATPAALVYADADRLMQVFANLLSNAAKFSPAGATVTVALDRVDGALRVSFADRGPGIPEEFHERIFSKFVQADSSSTRQKGGTGLGLSIARAIVERMGGRIGFTTAIGAGTTFYVDLPEWNAPSIT